MKTAFTIGCIAAIQQAAAVQVQQYGYNSGYGNQGYSQGYNQGYNQGYGHNNYNQGYNNQSYNQGYSNNYNKGYGGFNHEQAYKDNPTYHDQHYQGSQVYFNVPRTQQIYFQHNHKNDEIYGYNRVNRVAQGVTYDTAGNTTLQGNLNTAMTSANTERTNYIGTLADNRTNTLTAVHDQHQAAIDAYYDAQIALL